MIKNDENTRWFRFKQEGEGNPIYTIPQTVVDGSDTISFQSNWTKENVQGSTEPMVAFNYVDAPQININLKFHEDMWREAQGSLNNSYIDVINKFASMIYPGENNQMLKSPYCLVYIGTYVYRGYFSSIRINQSGPFRNGYQVSCEINSTFVIIKKTSPKRLGVSDGFRTYFN